jgi:hypothetical protein
MADFVNFLMLIAASIGAMVLGVLAAYGTLRVAFAFMRPHRQGSVVKAQAREARI